MTRLASLRIQIAVNCCLAVQIASAQQGTQPAPLPLPGASTPYKLITPAVQPNVTPGVLLLTELEGRFQQSVAEGGGKAFANWFAEDAVTLSNGKPAVRGRGAIAAVANWDPKVYSLTWVVEGAEMGAANDMGFTWGHYVGRTLVQNGPPSVMTGRYITVWKKLANGAWKVALDASANEPAAEADCCSVPQPGAGATSITPK